MSDSVNYKLFYRYLVNNKVDVRWIIYDNFIKENANRDVSLFTKFKIKFYLNKQDYYFKRFESKLNELSNTLNLSNEIVLSHLLLEIKQLELYPTLNMPSDIDIRNHYDVFRIKDLSIIELCVKLERLVLTGQDVFNLTKIDRFKLLKELSVISDLKKLESKYQIIGLDSLDTLEYLYFLNLRGNYISDFQKIKNKNIKFLILSNTNLELIDLCDFPNLKFLDVFNTPLLNLNGIEKYHDLEVLCLGNNHIKDYTPLCKLKKLRLVTYYESDVEKNKVTEELISKYLPNNNECILVHKYDFTFLISNYKDLISKIQKFLKYNSELI